MSGNNSMEIVKKVIIFIIWGVVMLNPLTSLSQASESSDLSFERIWPQSSTSWCFNLPGDVAVDDDGNIYVLDVGNHRIQKYTSSRNFITSWGSPGDGKGQFIDAVAMAFDPDGYIYVSDSGYYGPTEGQVSRVQKFTLSGQWVGVLDRWGEDNKGFNDPRGIAVDKEGNVYIADADEGDKDQNNRIHKFSANGDFIRSWQIFEVDNWNRAQISDVAVAPDGNILALVNSGSDYPQGRDAHPVQRFTPDGVLLDKWTVDPGREEALSDGLFGISVDKDNHVYISKIWGNRIKIFSKNGEEIENIGGYGTGEVQFNQVYGITLDQAGDLYVADTENYRIQKVTSQGDFIFSMGCSGSGASQFINPEKILVGPDEKVYVADSTNDRVQVFEKNGRFLYEILTGDYVTSVAVDHEGYLYTVHPWQNYIKKFAPNGGYITQWNSAGDVPFEEPVDVVFSPDHHLYVADKLLCRVYRMTTDGEVVEEWGRKGNGQGEFVAIQGLDVASDGSVYVVDFGWYVPEVKDCPEAENNPHETCGEEIARVHRFDAHGNYLLQWGGRGTQDGRFIEPLDVAVDHNGDIWVADSGNHRIQKFDPQGFWIETYGEQGTEPGMFARPGGVTSDQEGRLFITEKGNNRVQVLLKAQEQTQGQDRAIIVAGGGPFQGNVLWNATQMCANMAYRTLLYQGYTREGIYYLSWDTGLDLDGNSLPDDVDGIPSNDTLQYALETWAAGAGNLLIYMTDHGGFEQFRVGEVELVQASQFKGWFEKAHRAVAGKTVLIYDACRSGSFLPSLASTTENPPIVITSSGEDESAYFTNNGTLSFSYLFWSAVQNGMKLLDAFLSTKNTIQFTYNNQSPMLDDNGNGVGNEDDDTLSAQLVTIGRGTVSAGDLPAIQKISLLPRDLDGEETARIYADNVIDADGIRRVWAVITPPDFLPGPPENPVMHLPDVELKPVDGNGYQGEYSGFTAKGRYHVAVYAEDRLGNISLPSSTTVLQSSGDASAVMGMDIFHFRLPCIKIGDSCWELLLQQDTSRASGVFYTLDIENLNEVSCTSVCAELLPNFDIDIFRVVYGGNGYTMVLRYIDDLSQLIWELDLTSIAAVP